MKQVTAYPFKGMKELPDEIRMTDLDTELTQPSQEAPGCWHLYLNLSGEPPREWVKIFELERRFPRHRRWRKAWVEGAHIVIDCVPEELEQFHLNHLKEDVVNANNKFLEWSARNEAENLRQLQDHAAARKRLEELRVRLKFD